jgi:hypothetical protein
MDDSANPNIKEFLIVIPLIASALAVTFDVGYFWGTDINFFNVFSVSEHVGFAIEALPFALFFAIGSFIVPLLMEHLNVLPKRERPGRPWWLYLSIAIWIVATGILTVFYRSFAMGSLLITGAIAFVMMRTIVKSPWRLVLGCIFALLIMDFTLGLDLGVRYSESDRFPYTIVPKQGAELKARIVRSGDRGVLFYIAGTNRLTLLPWDQIKQVEGQ